MVSRSEESLRIYDDTVRFAKRRFLSRLHFLFLLTIVLLEIGQESCAKDGTEAFRKKLHVLFFPPICLEYSDTKLGCTEKLLVKYRCLIILVQPASQPSPCLDNRLSCACYDLMYSFESPPATYPVSPPSRLMRSGSTALRRSGTLYTYTSG